jgi:hypothetical protein
MMVIMRIIYQMMVEINETMEAIYAIQWPKKY